MLKIDAFLKNFNKMSILDISTGLPHKKKTPKNEKRFNFLFKLIHK